MTTTAVRHTPDRAHHQVTFVVLALGVFAYSLLQSFVTPVLPTIQHALHTSQTNVTWVLTAYLLSASIFTPILGRLGDMTGKKRMFVVALLALAIGSLLAAVAPSLGVMIIARAIQGIGGGVLPLAFGIIRDEFPNAKVPGAVSLIASLVAVGGGLGIVLAGPIVDALDYHWLFWIPLVITTGAAAAAHFLVPESIDKHAGRINWLAAALLSGWLVALLLGVSQAPTWGWGSFKVVGLIVVAVVLGTAWVVVETRSANPLIDMKMMRIRAVWATNLVALLFGVGMYALFAFLPEFVQTPSSAGYGFGASITESGLMLLPLTVTMFVLGMVTGRLGEKFGSKNVLIFGSVVSFGSFLFLALAHDQKWEIYASMAVMGVGFGMAFSAMPNLIVAAVPPEQTGVASGMNANIRTIGGSLGAAFMASIVAAGVAQGATPKESGYTHGYYMLGGAMALSALAAILIPAARRDPATHHEPAADLRHAELAIVAGGTVVGDESE